MGIDRTSDSEPEKKQKSPRRSKRICQSEGIRKKEERSLQKSTTVITMELDWAAAKEWGEIS